MCISFTDLENENADRIKISYKNISYEEVVDVYLKDLFIKGRVGLTPDPLVPTKTISLKADNYTKTFVKIRIPDSVPPGNYKGKIKIDTGSRLEIDYRLKVWDFMLPASPTLNTAFEIHTQELPQKERNNHIKGYLDNMAEHRISAVNYAYPDVTLQGDKLLIDTTRFDKLTGYALDKLRMNTFYMPYTLYGVHEKSRNMFGEKLMSRRWQSLMGRYLTDMSTHVKENGWQDKLIYFIWDEPSHHKQVKAKIIETAKFIDRFHPNAKKYVSTPEGYLTEQEAAELNISTALFTITLDKAKVSQYPTTWMSLDGVCRDWISADLIKPRMLPWIAWAYHIKGLELWSVNAWHDDRFAGDAFSFDASIQN